MTRAIVRRPHLATLVGAVVAAAPAFAVSDSIDSPEAAQGVSLDRFGAPVMPSNTEQQQ
jgi:hypothetical protein